MKEKIEEIVVKINTLVVEKEAELSALRAEEIQLQQRLAKLQGENVQRAHHADSLKKQLGGLQNLLKEVEAGTKPLPEQEAQETVQEVHVQKQAQKAVSKLAPEECAAFAPADWAEFKSTLEVFHVLSVLRKMGELHRTRIAIETGIPKDTVDLHVDRLSEAGRVQVSSGGLVSYPVQKGSDEIEAEDAMFDQAFQETREVIFRWLAQSDDTRETTEYNGVIATLLVQFEPVTANRLMELTGKSRPVVNRRLRALAKRGCLARVSKRYGEYAYSLA